jgi:hypothetical protein
VREVVMSKKAIGVAVFLLILSLVAVAMVVRAQAQFHHVEPVTPRVIAGPEFGFRIEGEQNGVAVGVPVVRIDGKWVPARIGSVDAKGNLAR